MKTILGFLIGFVLMIAIDAIFFRVESTVTVTISDSTVNYKSNRNSNGDAYYIVKNGDTLSRGV